MDEEKIRKKLGEQITDILGYPFHVNSIEVNVLPEPIEDIVKGIIEAFIEEYCGNCEMTCNDRHCDGRDHSGYW